MSALKLTYLDWPRLLEGLRDRQRLLEGARWSLGDTLAEAQEALAATPQMEEAFAREGVSWRRLGLALGLRSAELTELMLVARAFPAGKRVSGVGWTHHRHVLRALPDASLSLRQRWLREAARHGWTAPTLVRRIRREATEQGPVPRPRTGRPRPSACRARPRRGEPNHPDDRR